MDIKGAQIFFSASTFLDLNEKFSEWTHWNIVQQHNQKHTQKKPCNIKTDGSKDMHKHRV